MSLKGKKIAIFVEQDYQDVELWFTYYRLIEEGIEVKIVGPGTASEYKGKYGYPAQVDANVSEISVDDFDAVMIPGGFAPDLMRKSDEMIKFVKEMYDAGKVVAAICHGVWIPASAGILKEKIATCYHAIKDDIKNAGAEYVDEPVVVDDNLITSRKPDDLPQFVQAIMKGMAK